MKDGWKPRINEQKKVTRNRGQKVETDAGLKWEDQNWERGREREREVLTDMPAGPCAPAHSAEPVTCDLNCQLSPPSVATIPWSYLTSITMSSLQPYSSFYTRGSDKGYTLIRCVCTIKYEPISLLTVVISVVLSLWEAKYTIQQSLTSDYISTAICADLRFLPDCAWIPGLPS